jgi:hypothetical protein
MQNEDVRISSRHPLPWDIIGTDGSWSLAAG